MNLSHMTVVLSWLPVLLASVAMAMSVYSPSDLTPQDIEGEDADTYIIKDAPSSKGSTTAWLDQVLSSMHQYNAMPHSAHKRAQNPVLSEAALALHKRNNGIWIWMPAQGYVSVPKDEQMPENGKEAKHGKIMRYGRKKRFSAESQQRL